MTDQELVEKLAAAIENHSWHPGGVKGSINPGQAAELIRNLAKLWKLNV